MSTQKKSIGKGTVSRRNTPAATSKSKTPEDPKTEKLIAAYVVPAELGDALNMAIGELPIKFHQTWLPFANQLAKCRRVDLEITTPDE